MRIFEYPPGLRPAAWGQLHGTQFQKEIRELADIRLDLCTRIGGFRDEDEVLQIAEEHLPILEAFSPELHEELAGIASGAALSPARVVVLNHYTDLRDIAASRRAQEEEEEAGGCSALWARAGGASILGQTWDMHASAAPFTMMLKIPAHGAAPAAWVTTITGCIGMAGMNAAGVGITINNLRSLDARVGLVWPALVRRVLWETNARAARDLVVRAPLGSGHHYLVADAEMAFGVETSGERHAVTFDGGDGTYIHTNHCLDPIVGQVSTVSEGSTTYTRFDKLAATAEGIARVDDVWDRLQAVNMPPSPDNKHGFATCSAIVMDLTAKRVWAAPAGERLVPEELPL